jgi:subtilisin family serine protease
MMALNHAVAHGIRLVCMPFFSRERDSQIWPALIKRVSARGTVIVCPAGNDGDLSPGLFGSIAETISVAAVDHEDRLTSHTNYGPLVTVCAPGVDVWSVWPGGEYAVASGTAIACAIVTGVLAMMLATSPTATPEELTKILMSSGEDINHKNSSITPEDVPRRVNAYAAVSAAHRLEESKSISGPQQ